MKDNYGRVIDYMRVSITDRCNLRCKYCMPEGVTWIPMEEILTLEEIETVCLLAADMGIRKIKVTGGEPLVRKGCPDLIKMLKGIPQVEQVTLTTNGVLLEKYAGELAANGLDAVNVSLDTLDPARYERITGRPELGEVLKGIEAMEAHAVPVKINVVPHQMHEEKGEIQELYSLVEMARDRRLDVRFIEMMPVGHGKEFQPISNTRLLKDLRCKYGEMQPETAVHGNGPAVYYKIPGFQGSIGFISAIHGKFCDQCNRIRLTSTGQLKPCLCYADSISLKESLRAGNLEEVRSLIREAILSKPASHSFDKWETVTETREMAKIGG
ncbi:GTP 3',8-cyclase MoaA [Roseburia hominis]